MRDSFHDHLSADELQGLLDRAIPERERRRIEEHLATCARCCEELDGWRLLFEDLQHLPTHRPREGFGDRVMASIELPERTPLVQRLWRRLGRLLPEGSSWHPGGERLQDFLDGSLPSGATARVASHVEGCTACRSELGAWRTVYARLGGLEGFTPGEGFADRVMAHVRMPAPALARAPAAASPAVFVFARAAWGRTLATAGRLAPRTRRAWATLSGIAVAPAVTVGLLIFTVFSHPTLTPGALASFAAWKVTALLSAGWSGLASSVWERAPTLGLDLVTQVLFDAPYVVAGGALAYSLVSALALRVLYKNLIGSRSHARALRS